MTLIGLFLLLTFMVSLIWLFKTINHQSADYKFLMKCHNKLTSGEGLTTEEKEKFFKILFN